MDWAKFVFDPDKAWVERLRQVALQRFSHDLVLADEAFTYALDKLSADDWKRLGEYSGKASPGAYLTVVFGNLLEDFSRSKFGRPRPPAWLKSLGGAWLSVYQLLCVERVDIEAAVVLLQQEGRDPEFVREAIRQIKRKIPNCGAPSAIAVDFESISESEIVANGDTPVSSLETETQRRREQWAADLLELIEADGDLTAVGVELDQTTALLIRLVYLEGLSVAAAARFLKTPEHTCRRRIKKALAKLQSAIV